MLDGKPRRRYRTPVLVFRRGNRLIIALTYGRESQWVHNVLAQDGCELETEGRTISLSHPYLSRRAAWDYTGFRPVHAAGSQCQRFPRAHANRDGRISMIYA
jgi:hypothetical protein